MRQICNQCLSVCKLKDCRCLKCGNILDSMFTDIKEKGDASTTTHTRGSKDDILIIDGGVYMDAGKEDSGKVELGRPVVKFTKEMIGRKKLYKTGKKPGKGAYVCIECNEDLFLDDKSDRLPPCGRCHKTTFVRERTI